MLKKEFLSGPVVTNASFTAEGTDLIPDWGTKILNAMPHGQKKC